MTHLDFFKKLKRLTPLDPTTRILAFFFVSVCFILCFIYLDYRAVTTEFRSSVDPPSLIEWSGINGSLDESRRPRYLEEGGGDGCDVFDGEWVWDDSYPLYKSEDCLFLDNGFRCSENGRPDSFYTKWRWQPKNCDLPRGCYFQEGEKVKMEMSVESALRRAIETMVDWIGSEVNLSKTQVIFRSYAPVHFRSGNWKTGGNCHRETLPDLGSLPVSPQTWGHFKTVIDVLTEHSNKSQVKKMDFLNVTYMTSRRKDGHLSLYYLGPKIGLAPLHRQDCSHWCLPGVPDSWNELLYVNFLKREHNRMSYAHH